MKDKHHPDNEEPVELSSVHQESEDTQVLEDQIDHSPPRDGFPRVQEEEIAAVEKVGKKQLRKLKKQFKKARDRVKALRKDLKKAVADKNRKLVRKIKKACKGAKAERKLAKKAYKEARNGAG